MAETVLNDWGVISKLKAEHDAKMIEIEKEKLRNDKKIYRKELNGQAFLRELQQSEEKRAKEAEIQRIAEQKRQFDYEDRLRKEQEQRRRSELTEMLDMHTSSQRKLKDEKKMQSFQEDQRYASLAQAKMREAELLKKEKKEFEFRQSQEMLNMLEYQQKLKAQEKDKVREMELRIIEERKIVDAKREQEHQAYFQMLNDKQLKNARNFSQNALTKAMEKELIINQWIHKGMDELNRKQSYEVLQANKKKQDYIKMTQGSLQEHLQLKEQKKRELQQEKDRIAQEALNNLRSIQNADMENKMMEKQRKQEYLEHLKVQAHETASKRMHPDQLTENEKKLNRFLVSDENITPRFQMPANTIIGSPSYKSSSRLNYRF